MFCIRCYVTTYRIVRRETTISFGSKSGSEFLENIISLVNPVTRRKMCRMEIISLSDNTRAVVRERKITLFKSYTIMMPKKSVHQNITELHKDSMATDFLRYTIFCTVRRCPWRLELRVPKYEHISFFLLIFLTEDGINSVKVTKKDNKFHLYATTKKWAVEDSLLNCWLDVITSTKANSSFPIASK